MNQLITYIESHGHSAVAFRGRLLVTCKATQRLDGRMVAFDLTETIEPTVAAVRRWLGY